MSQHKGISQAPESLPRTIYWASFDVELRAISCMWVAGRWRRALFGWVLSVERVGKQWIATAQHGSMRVQVISRLKDVERVLNRVDHELEKAKVALNKGFETPHHYSPKDKQ